MVCQLALQDDTTRSSITEILAQEPDLLTRSLGQQVTKLLSDVMGHVQSSHPIVLVLDALDEYETDSQGREGGELLLFLARSVISSTSSVKSLVTIRLEPTIHKMFDEIKTSTSGSEVLQLHDIDRTIVRNDIQHYLE
jgi:hypothetical protein